MNASPKDGLAHDPYLESTLPPLRPRLWTFALRLAGNRRDALELVRRACAHAFERPDQFPTGFPTPGAMLSLVHFIWFHEVRPARGYPKTEPLRPVCRSAAG
jgi:DNA-directed RNA polymerase specialized sigma24 family protein